METESNVVHEKDQHCPEKLNKSRAESAPGKGKTKNKCRSGEKWRNEENQSGKPGEGDKWGRKNKI